MAKKKDEPKELEELEEEFLTEEEELEEEEPEPVVEEKSEATPLLPFETLEDLVGYVHKMPEKQRQGLNQAELAASVDRLIRV